MLIRPALRKRLDHAFEILPISAIRRLLQRLPGMFKRFLVITRRRIAARQTHVTGPCVAIPLGISTGTPPAPRRTSSPPATAARVGESASWWPPDAVARPASLSSLPHRARSSITPAPWSGGRCAHNAPARSKGNDVRSSICIGLERCHRHRKVSTNTFNDPEFPFVNRQRRGNDETARRIFARVTLSGIFVGYLCRAKGTLPWPLSARYK